MEEAKKIVDEPAFPCSSPIQYWWLSKRDYFAAMAMQGMLAAQISEDWTAQDAAEIAVAHADALINALSEPAGGAA